VPAACDASAPVIVKGHHLQIFVRDNNIDQALKALKRKMQREGIFREMKRRSFYEKPSEKRTREKAEGIRRSRKAARKLAQREGLLPAPKKKRPVMGGRRPPAPSA
jgi:small subunit ribosomal protein S21